jgi:hypothetical protein
LYGLNSFYSREKKKMIVRKTTKVIYTIELTEQQREDLILLMEIIRREGRDVIAIQAEHGTEVADRVKETCDDLLQSL